MLLNHDAVRVFSKDILAGNVIGLMGEPGVGKSSVIEELAETLGTKAFCIAINTCADRTDFTGIRLVPKDATKTDWIQKTFPLDTIAYAVDYAKDNPDKPVILFYDEVNRASTDVMTAVMATITDRKLGSTLFPDNIRIVVAGNTKGNVSMMDDAFITRFALYQVTPDPKRFMELMGDDLNPYIKEALEKNPASILERGRSLENTNNDDSAYDFVDDEMVQSTNPRTLHSLNKLLNTLDASDYVDFFRIEVGTPDRKISLLQEMIEAKLGITTLSENLLEIIATHIANGSISNAAQNNAVTHTYPEPASWSSLTNVTSMADLDAIINTLSDEEKSNNLVYAVFSPRNNTNIINALAPAVDQLTNNDLAAFTMLTSNHQMNLSNLTTLRNTKATIANKLAIIIGIMVS